jgi:PPM family protein phosphatase
MRVRFSGETHVGMKRKHNEDSFGLPDEERLALVADGMGGHASGEVASQMAVETIVNYFKSTQDAAELTWPFKLDRGTRYEANRLEVAVKLANQRIHETAQRKEELHGMGTTIVAGVFLDDRVVVAHVGDSRAYRLRKEQLLQLTEDHSLLNDYLKMSRLREDEAGKFQQKNVIVRALGMKESVQVDVLIDQPQLHDVYLLCSDGLTGMVSDADMCEILVGERDLDRACERLIAAANDNGGVDNITVVLARLEPL